MAQSGFPVPLLSMAAPKQHQQKVSGPNTPQVSSDLDFYSYYIKY
jgi:hypothetical protein